VYVRVCVCMFEKNPTSLYFNSCYLPNSINDLKIKYTSQRKPSTSSLSKVFYSHARWTNLWVFMGAVEIWTSL